MNRDDVLHIAKKAKILGLISSGYIDQLERFAALVAAHEREECAKLCETIVTPSISWVKPHDFHWAAYCCASEIRARGKQ